MEPVAIWGALTGTAGMAIAGRRELLGSRRRLAVRPSLRLITSRLEPVGEIVAGYACISVWNIGGRPLAVERLGFRIPLPANEIGGPFELRALIALESPIEAAVDGQSHQVFTPLGPMLAAGIDPFDLLEAFAVTTGDRDWAAPLQPLIFSRPPGMSAELLQRGLERLREGAERPPRVGDQIALTSAEPVLPDELPPLE
jgi:hypothetical protein